MSDRCVHARYDGIEIVRYDRSGKWYLEPTEGGLARQRVRVVEAVASAIWGLDNANGEVIHGLPGGAEFDRRIRQIRDMPNALVGVPESR